MDLKQIIRLHLDGISNRKIGETLNISRNTINDYMTLFEVCDKNLKTLLELKEDELKELFSSKTTINNDSYEQLMPFLEKANKARHQVGFTLLYHHNEYKGLVDKSYSYTQFMEHYSNPGSVNTAFRLWAMHWQKT